MGVRYYWLRKKIQINKKRIPWSKNDVKLGWLTCLNCSKHFASSAENKTTNASTTSMDKMSEDSINCSLSENFFQDFDTPPSPSKIMPPLSIDINLITSNSPQNTSSPIISTRSSCRICRKNQFLDNEMWFREAFKKDYNKKTFKNLLVTIISAQMM